MMRPGEERGLGTAGGMGTVVAGTEVTGQDFKLM